MGELSPFQKPRITKQMAKNGSPKTRKVKYSRPIAATVLDVENGAVISAQNRSVNIVRMMDKPMANHNPSINGTG